MKRFGFIAVQLALLMVCGACLTGCSSKEYELSHYSGETKDGNGRTVYNTDLYYSNQVKQGYPDPCVLDDTARTGYYYLFGTADCFTTMRSKNLVEWEDVGPTFFPRQSEEVRRATAYSNWAPEVVYDEETSLYYLFFSARQESVSGTAEDSFGKDESVDQNKAGVVSNESLYNMYVAVSDNPSGPYKMVDFTDADSCGEAYLHTYNQSAGKEISQTDAESGKYAYVIKDNRYYEAAFPHYWAKYCLFSPDELSKVMNKNKVGTGGNANYAPEAGYFATIDPHPYVDPVPSIDTQTGEEYHKKYLYFKTEKSNWNINVAVEMKDWLTPIWSTAQYVTANGYYTIDDWKKGTNYGVSYEYTECNEGPHVIYHQDKTGKGLYYFTYSTNNYTSSMYQVGVAISESPLGPFRKLTEEEGGLLICSSSTGSRSVSGAGHHSFSTIGDQLYITYHRHNDYLVGGTSRYTATDEVRWITVKDIYGNDMDVPYVNGPTDSLQPLPEFYSGYQNVADKAMVSCTSKDAEVSWLTDGLLSVHKTANSVFMDYIQETYITETSTFTFDFDEAQSIRSVMIYNSALEENIFKNIASIELVLPDGSSRVMRDIAFDIEQYCVLGGQNGDRILYVMPGSSAFAEFYDIEVKSVRITIEKPSDQDKVGISEIRILGKA